MHDKGFIASTIYAMLRPMLQGVLNILNVHKHNAAHLTDPVRGGLQSF